MKKILFGFIGMFMMATVCFSCGDRAAQTEATDVDSTEVVTDTLAVDSTVTVADSVVTE